MVSLLHELKCFKYYVFDKYDARSVLGCKLMILSYIYSCISDILCTVFAMLAWYMLWPYVCLFVCLSLTSRCSTKTAKCRITQTTPLDSPGTSFLMPKIASEFDWGHPVWGHQMQVVQVKIGDLQQMSRKWYEIDAYNNNNDRLTAFDPGQPG